MFTTLPIETTVLLTLILIDAGLLAVCLFILLNTAKATIRSSQSLFRAARQSSSCCLLLAWFIFTTITVLYVRDQYLGQDDEPPPLELEASTVQQEAVSISNFFTG